MELIITQWALDSYLELKEKRVFTDEEYRTIIREDVLRLRAFPDDPKFKQPKFWSPAQDQNGKIIMGGYKMKWHNVGNGKEFELFKIAIQMKKAGFSDSFIVASVKTALTFEGVADLMNLWSKEKDEKEREEIIADIQDMIEECLQKGKTDELYVKFNDLEAISKDIRAFKDSLLQLVMEQGGISKLSELTGIPQPSLSRFFNSNSMPRRSTILKIAKALNLDELKINLLWSK